MATSNSWSGRRTKLQQTKLLKEQRVISPERTVVWTEPPNLKQKRVPVLYYLSRNGQLEHPHFMEVPLSSSHGLFLSDVINRLDVLRGKGMASMYSWSCKRSYKNGYVWHDLSENDLIYPAHGHEYVLKGSDLRENPILDTGFRNSPRRQPPPESQTTGGDDQDCPPAADRRRRNQYSSFSSIDSDKSTPADISTQTDVNRRRRKPSAEDEIEVSTPPSDSSPETLETLMKADGRVALRHERGGETATAATGSQNNQIQKNHQVPRFRSSSSVLMQLLSCGVMSFKDCGAGSGLGMIGPQKIRGPRGPGIAESGGGKLERKEYFSGSLVETKKEEFPALRRSTSYNADRRPYLEVEEKEISEDVKAKCIPTRPRAQSSTRKGPLLQH